jgi:hypothetical protein
VTTEVTLCWSELQQAAHVGCQRQLRALARRAAHRVYAPEDPWGTHVIAAAAEMAVAKALGLYWADSPALDYAGDVGPYQVRSTVHHNGHLSLRDSDSDDAAFVLVIADVPTFRIPGWILGRDGRQSCYWSERVPYPCFMVPQSALLPLAELPTRALA